MAETVKIGMNCVPGYTWATQEKDGTVWHGLTNFMLKELKKIFPRIELVHNQPKANWSSPSIQAIHEGSIDIDSFLYGINYRRYQYVDFATPVSFADMGIISVKSVNQGRITEGIFDTPTYILIVAAIILLSLTLWIIERMDISFSKCLMYIFGSVMRQSMNQKHSTFGEKAVIMLVGIGSVALTTMYSSKITSNLTIGHETQNIQGFEDLVMKYPDVKIYAYRGSYQEDLLKSSAFYDQLKSRVVLIEKSRETPEIVMAKYQNIHQGTHVMINYLVNTKRDYERRMPLSVACSIPLANIRISPPLANVPLTLVHKKKFRYVEQMQNILLQLRSFGIMFTHIQEIRRFRNQDGIFSPKRYAKTCRMYKQKSKLSQCATVKFSQSQKIAFKIKML